MRMARYGYQIRSLKAILCLLFCINVEGSEGPGYPEQWPDIDNVAALSCHSIVGSYLSQGQSTSTLSLDFEHPIFVKNFYGMEEIASPTNHFQFEIDHAQQKLITKIFSEDNLLLAVKSDESQFECLGGWVTFVSSVKGGSGESPHISSNLKTQIAVANDGSLIVHSVLKSYSKEFLLFKKERVTDIWYRYPPYK